LYSSAPAWSLVGTMLSISPKQDSLDEPEAVPIGDVRPVVGGEGLGAQMAALAKYMVRTEVHTYAFSVAANVILSLFPFIVMMLTISRQVFHSQAMVGVVREMMTGFLPSNQDFIMRNMVLLVKPHKSTQVYSVIMLLISSTGVFLPLEVALNGVWGVKENRSYLRNQAVSLGLAFVIGVLAMVSVGLTTAQSWIFVGQTGSVASVMLHGGTATILGIMTSVLIFFLIYWVLPNRKVPARAVLPTAIVIGLLWEAAKVLYVWTLPHLNFGAVYGPFEVSVGLMIWAFLSGLLLLAGAHFSATRYALAAARDDDRAEAVAAIEAKEHDAEAR
jgi:YihY family inner membrane protein